MAKRPRVACFHGGGSNSEIYDIQCARINTILKDYFECVFFNAPYERSAGPGVLPIFADYGPFRAWFTLGDDGSEIRDGSGYDSLGTDGLQRAWKMMEASAPKEDWIGVMGFSQGTRVAGGLLRDQQLRSARSEPNGFNLRFGILCMGGGDPMETKQNQIQQSYAATTDAQLITIPTLHLHGLKDGVLESGRKQKKIHYNEEASTLLEIDYHHAMPWNAEDVKRFTDQVKKLYESTRG